MKFILKLSLIFFISFSFLLKGKELPSHTPSALTEEQRHFLFNNEFVRDYWRLLRYFETQERGTFCGIASLTLILNGSSLEKPPAPEFKSAYFFTQSYVLQNYVQTFVPLEEVYRRGLSFNEMVNICENFPLQVGNYYGDQTNIEKMKSKMLNALLSRKKSIMVNFQRRLLGQTGGGHWSPVVGYNFDSDSFLVMDVARFKYPPFWVRSEDLLRSMQKDDRGVSRGFLVLESSD